MAIYIPEASRLNLVLRMLNAATVRYKLYTNTPTYTDDTLTASAFTEMGAVLSYADKTVVAPTGWSGTTPAAATPASAVATALTWTFTAGTLVNVQGYFVTDSAGTTLLWYEPFSAPKPVQYGGDQIVIVPTVTLDHA